jgi:hypothetical protein
MSSVINGIGGQMATKYAKINLKEETAKRFFRYIGQRTQDKEGRFTADDAITELLNSAGVE